MFHVDPDAWATVIAVLVICISIFASITGKLRKRRSPADLLWYSSELSMAILAAILAWDMHPYLPLPEFMTRIVFTAVAVHVSTRFVQYLGENALGVVKK